MSSSSSVHRMQMSASSSVPKPFIASCSVCASKSNRSESSALTSWLRALLLLSFSATSDLRSAPMCSPYASTTSFLM